MQKSKFNVKSVLAIIIVAQERFGDSRKSGDLFYVAITENILCMPKKEIIA